MDSKSRGMTTRECTAAYYCALKASTGLADSSPVEFAEPADRRQGAEVDQKEAGDGAFFTKSCS
jgi:hypothetical protein